MMMFLTSSGSSHPPWLTHIWLRRRGLPGSVVLGLNTAPSSTLVVRLRVMVVRVMVRMVGMVVVRVVVYRFLLAVYTAHVVMMTESKLSAVSPHTCTSPQSPAVRLLLFSTPLHGQH